MTLKQLQRWLNRRPKLRCSSCGYEWHPRGKNYSLQCPNCKIRFTKANSTSGGLLAVILLLLASPIVLCGGCLFLAIAMQPEYQAPTANSAALRAPQEENNLDTTEVDSPGLAIASDSKEQNEEQPSLSRIKYEQARARVAKWLQEHPEPSIPSLSPRLFVDAAGTHTVKATVTNINETHVQLEKESGVRITLKRTQLADLDRQYLHENFSAFVEAIGPWRNAKKELDDKVAALKKIADAEQDTTAEIEALYAKKQNSNTNVYVGVVVRILDGDTLQINDVRSGIHTIRLIGVDAPERGQKFADNAVQWLEKTLHPESHELVRVEYTERDRYGRTLGDVYFGDRWINQDIVEVGLAWHYEKYSDDVRLEASQDRARMASLGLWADTDRIAPWDFRNGVRAPANEQTNSTPKGTSNDTSVWVTNTGHKYHRRSCRYCDSSHREIPLSRAQSAYEPCKVCHPPTN